MSKLKIINLPTDIAPFLFQNKMVNVAKLFFTLKLNESSKIGDITSALKRSEHYTGIKYRTLNKHLNTLISEGWISKDKADNYYLRTVDYIRTKYKTTSKRFVHLSNVQVKNLRQFIVASYLADSIKNQETLSGIYKRNRKKSRVSINSEDATQRDVFLVSSRYFGMSSKTLSQKLGVSRSHAQSLIKTAKKLKYIKIRTRKKIIASGLSSQEVNHFKKTNLFENHKLRVSKSKNRKFGYYDVYEQLHNEIIPLLTIMKKKSWKVS